MLHGSIDTNTSVPAGARPWSDIVRVTVGPSTNSTSASTSPAEASRKVTSPMRCAASISHSIVSSAGAAAMTEAPVAQAAGIPDAGASVAAPGGVAGPLVVVPGPDASPLGGRAASSPDSPGLAGACSPSGVARSTSQASISRIARFGVPPRRADIRVVSADLATKGGPDVVEARLAGDAQHGAGLRRRHRSSARFHRRTVATASITASAQRIGSAPVGSAGSFDGFRTALKAIDILR
ncbi:MAG: hypothetical protein R2704_03220 [Microthrixaceae bacterium]